VPFGLSPVWSARNIQTWFCAGFGARHTKAGRFWDFREKAPTRCSAWAGVMPSVGAVQRRETMERAEAGAAEAAFTAPETYGLRRILLWENT